jgi:hypothetical protein
MKLILSFTIGILLIFLPLSVLAKQKNNSDQEKVQEEKIKEFVITKQTQEKHPRLRIKLKNGSYHVGYLMEVNDQNFKIKKKYDDLVAMPFKYFEVSKIQSGYSKTERLKKTVLFPVLLPFYIVAIPIALILGGCCG